MDEELRIELEATAKRLSPEIEKRFVDKEEKRNLREFLISAGFGTTEKFTKKILVKLKRYEIGDSLPSAGTLESMAYDLIGSLKTKKTIQMTPGMEAVATKFIRVFLKVYHNEQNLDSKDISEIDSKLKTVFSSIAQNEGGDAKEVIDYLEQNKLTPKTLLITDPVELKKQEMLNSLFNIRIITSKSEKPHPLFKLPYNEIAVISEAINNNAETVRISGDLFKIKEITSIKIFTVKDLTELNNELYWSSTLAEEAKKLYGNIGKWTYEKFLKFGEDVTSTFLNPAINHVSKKEILKPKIDVLALIKNGENKNVEFKRILSNDSTGFNKHVEHKVMKTVAAFLNTEGGTLLIGVDDDKKIIGLESDFNLFLKPDKKDAFALYFDSIIQSGFGSQICRSYTLEFIEIENKTIAVVNVPEKYSKPAFLKNASQKDKTQEFYIRTTNSSISLIGNEQAEYIKSHWT